MPLDPVPTAPRFTCTLRTTLIAALLSLGLAYTAQYGFGLHPCHLCLWQRVPYALVILLSVIGLLMKHKRTVLVAVIALAFLADSATAAYHTGVEKHWIEGPGGCTAAGLAGSTSDEDFLNRINSAPIASCDQPEWEFHGITMAGLNTVWALALALFTFAALQSNRRSRPESAHA